MTPTWPSAAVHVGRPACGQAADEKVGVAAPFLMGFPTEGQPVTVTGWQLTQQRLPLALALALALPLPLPQCGLLRTRRRRVRTAGRGASRRRASAGPERHGACRVPARGPETQRGPPEPSGLL